MQFNLSLWLGLQNGRSIYKIMNAIQYFLMVGPTKWKTSYHHGENQFEVKWMYSFTPLYQRYNQYLINLIDIPKLLLST